jgi:hypothetical protein
VKFWKVFEDDAELTRFLGVIDEFADLQIDLENEHDEKQRSLSSEVRLEHMKLFNCPPTEFLKVWSL